MSAFLLARNMRSNFATTGMVAESNTAATRNPIIRFQELA
jgi:hypothetical protein